MQHSEQRQCQYEECAGDASNRFATDPIRQDPDRHEKGGDYGAGRRSQEDTESGVERHKAAEKPAIPGRRRGNAIGRVFVADRRGDF